MLAREPANILVHPADAAAAGVADGAAVVVESAFGRLTAVVKVDGGIRRGHARSRTGSPTPNVSTLLSATENVDLLTGMPTYSGVPVTLGAA